MGKEEYEGWERTNKISTESIFNSGQFFNLLLLLFSVLSLELFSRYSFVIYTRWDPILWFVSPLEAESLGSSARVLYFWTSYTILPISRYASSTGSLVCAVMLFARYCMVHVRYRFEPGL